MAPRSKSPTPLHDLPLIGSHLPHPNAKALAPLLVTLAFAHKDVAKAALPLTEILSRTNAVNVDMVVANLGLGGFWITMLWAISAAQSNRGGHWITSMANTFLSMYGGIMGVSFLTGTSLMDFATDKNFVLVIVAWCLANASQVNKALEPIETILENEYLAIVMDIINEMYRAKWAIAGMALGGSKVGLSIAYGVLACSNSVLPLGGGSTFVMSDAKKQAIWICSIVTILASETVFNSISKPINAQVSVNNDSVVVYFVTSMLVPVVAGFL